MTKDDDHAYPVAGLDARPPGDDRPLVTPDRGDRWDPGITGSLASDEGIRNAADMGSNQPGSTDATNYAPSLPLQLAKQRIAEVGGLLSVARNLCRQDEVRSGAAASAMATAVGW